MSGRDWYSDFMNRSFEEIMEHLLKDIFGSPPSFQRPLDNRAAYRMLGLEESASDEEVKKRYLNLAKRLHPDVSGKETEHLFKLIQTAYERIKQERKWS